MINLILIPGLLCDASLYQPVINAFNHHYQIQIADVSSCKTIEGCAQAICDDIKQDVVLVGFSLGAWIALHCYSMLQQYCKGIVLISSAPGNLTTSTKQRFEHYISEITSGHFESFIDEDYEQDISIKNKSNPDLKDTFIAMAKKQGENIAINQLRAMLEFKGDNTNLAHIKCPTLLIRGEDDRSLNIQKQEQMLQEISQSKLVIIPNAAHYVLLENPEMTALEIDAWVSSSKIG